jgi:Flp pilus assembly protein TadB
MEVVAEPNQTEKSKFNRNSKTEAPVKVSLIKSMLDDYLLKPSILTSLTYINLCLGYFALMAMIAGKSLNLGYFLVYVPIIYILFVWREAEKEKTRLEIAQRLPYFADALANALSVGSTLEQAFTQAAYYLKGKIKEEFSILVLKNALGKDLGVLLRELDSKFPRTGLRYLISLLEEYKELGVGISPLLKRIAEALSVKEEAEEKIKTILAGGSSYAKLTIGIFVAIFLGISLLLKDQFSTLLSPGLKPTFLFLCTWTCTGILIVTRVTTMDFAKNSALRPFIKKFMNEKDWTVENLMFYSAIEWNWWKRFILFYTPMLSGFLITYIVSWYKSEPLALLICYAISSYLSWMVIKYIIKGIIEDELIKTIETFPDLLQVFIIGLNSGLNTYLAFQFAQEAIKGMSPKLLTEELCRTKFAMECGEAHDKTWQRLADMLPFETVVDFCEIMVIAPMQGESIVKSIIHMNNSYQQKKLTLIEKKATTLGMIVIPIIVVAFFPLFLFSVFGPLITRIMTTFQHG